jgi:3-phosphoshikimate 1-carboxyvinyltransferase
VGPLAGALHALGGDVAFTGRPGFPPIRVSGRLRGGKAAIDGSVSSQFVSSVLMAAPYADDDVELTLPATVASRSYLDVTADVMLRFGARLERRGYDWFRVKSGVPYRGITYWIEGDYSSASYLFAVAAVCGGRVTVTGLNPASVQGDRRFLDALEAMGCRVTAGTGADGRPPGYRYRYVLVPRHRPDARGGGGSGRVADDDHRDRAPAVQGERSRRRDGGYPPEDGRGRSRHG